jgi:hypothetical protein
MKILQTLHFASLANKDFTAKYRAGGVVPTPEYRKDVSFLQPQTNFDLQ